METVEGNRYRTERLQELAATPLRYARQSLLRAANLKKIEDAKGHEPEFPVVLEIAERILALEELDHTFPTEALGHQELYVDLQDKVRELVAESEENKFLCEYAANIIRRVAGGESDQLRHAQLVAAKEFVSLIARE